MLVRKELLEQITSVTLKLGLKCLLSLVFFVSRFVFMLIYQIRVELAVQSEKFFLFLIRQSLDLQRMLSAFRENYRLVIMQVFETYGGGLGCESN